MASKARLLLIALLAQCAFADVLLDECEDEDDQSSCSCWVLYKGFSLGYHNMEAIFFTIDPVMVTETLNPLTLKGTLIGSPYRSLKGTLIDPYYGNLT